MPILLLLMLIPVLLILWVIVPILIRDIVNRWNGDIEIRVMHHYEKRRGRVFYDWFMTSWHYRIMDRALIVNLRWALSVSPEEESESLTTPGAPSPKIKRARMPNEQHVFREEYWVNAPTPEIMQRGYKPIERLHDGLLWIGVPVYAAVADCHKFIVPTDKDDDGQYIYPQHTPAILDNMAKSNANQRFRKLLTKTAPTALDTHALMMLVIIIAGAVGGMWLLGII